MFVLKLSADIIRGQKEREKESRVHMSKRKKKATSFTIGVWNIFRRVADPCLFTFIPRSKQGRLYQGTQKGGGKPFFIFIQMTFNQARWKEFKKLHSVGRCPLG